MLNPAAPAGDSNRGETGGTKTMFVDRAALSRMADDLGGPAVLMPIVAAFLDEADQRAGAVQPPANQDRTEARRASHMLKSTAALLGAHRLSLAAKELEQLFDANQSPDAQTLRDFNEIMAETCTELEVVQAELEGR